MAIHSSGSWKAGMDKEKQKLSSSYWHGNRTSFQAIHIVAVGIGQKGRREENNKKKKNSIFPQMKTNEQDSTWASCRDRLGTMGRLPHFSV